MTISSKFLAPLTGLPLHYLQASKFEIYLGDYSKTGEEWSDSLFLYLDSPINPIIEMIGNDASYIDAYKPEGKKGTMFRKELTVEEQNNILKPFIQGKYSEIDRTYVFEHFPKHKIVGIKNHRLIRELREDYMVLTKHPQLREFWELKLDVSLPEDAELYDKPIKSKEILNFNEYVETKEVGLQSAGTPGNGGSTSEVTEK